MPGAYHSLCRLLCRPFFHSVPTTSSLRRRPLVHSAGAAMTNASATHARLRTMCCGYMGNSQWLSLRQLHTTAKNWKKSDADATTTTTFGLSTASSPRSLKMPTAQELRQTDALCSALQKNGVIIDNKVGSSAASSDQIWQVKEVKNVLAGWVQTMLKKSCVIDNHVRFYEFGSNTLGTQLASSDWDICMVTSNQILRQRFTKIGKYLKQHNITALMINAAVPVLKVSHHGVELDIVFASIRWLDSFPPDFDILGDSIMSEFGKHNYSKSECKSIKKLRYRWKTGRDLPTDWNEIGQLWQDTSCVCGPRVSHAILACIPQDSTVTEFQIATKAIKMWAKVNHIYGSDRRMFSGITWTILMARIAQLYPNATASKMLLYFFQEYNQYDWSAPVQLRMLSNEKPMYTEKIPTWPEHMRSSVEVITPLFPAQNTTHNLGPSTWFSTQAHLRYGQMVVSGIFKDDMRVSWALFLSKQMQLPIQPRQPRWMPVKTS